MPISLIKKNKSGFTPLEIAKTKRSMGKNNHPLSLTGFTLLETAIAIFISILVITSSLYAFNRGMSLIQTAKDVNIALHGARSACEEARRKLDTGSNIHSGSYYLPAPNDNCTLEISTPGELIKVEVSWQGEAERGRSVLIDMFAKERKYYY
jgi:type II secretory pathway pseudopilin PulG